MIRTFQVWDKICTENVQLHPFGIFHVISSRYDHEIFIPTKIFGFYFRFFKGDGKGFRVRIGPEFNLFGKSFNFRIPFVRYVNYRDYEQK